MRFLMLTVDLKCAPKTKNKKQDDIDRERKNHAVENRRLMRYFGLPEEDFPPATISEVAAIFDDHLEAFLSTNWDEWISACNIIETDAGINLAKNQLAYRTATLRSGGEVPEMLAQILVKVEGK